MSLKCSCFKGKGDIQKGFCPFPPQTKQPYFATDSWWKIRVERALGTVTCWWTVTAGKGNDGVQKQVCQENRKIKRKEEEMNTSQAENNAIPLESIYLPLTLSTNVYEAEEF